LSKTVAAAETIASARRAVKPLGRLPESIRPRDLAAGYDVQDAVNAILIGAGYGAIVGHKIGATTPVMQKYMEIDHPCAGAIFATTVYDSGVALPYSRFHKVGIECEVAVRIGRPMSPDLAPYDRKSAARHVESVMAAIELVDDRYISWQAMGTPSLAADDFFGAGSVLGKPVAPREVPDAASLGGRAIVNGAEVSRGVGADVMGHPLEALAWLANHFAARGRTLGSGEFVSTGSLVKTIWLSPGDHAAIEIDGLGRVEVSFPEG
jgi:2-oxo-3-hexenedioate decarboxylase/2-keto-4-pentenoate hydratase